MGWGSILYSKLKGCGCIGFLSPMHKISQIPIRKEKGATPGILASRLNNRWKYTTPGLCGRTAMLNTKKLVKYTIEKHTIDNYFFKQPVFFDKGRHQSSIPVATNIPQSVTESFRRISYTILLTIANVCQTKPSLSA